MKKFLKLLTINLLVLIVLCTAIELGFKVALNVRNSRAAHAVVETSPKNLQQPLPLEGYFRDIDEHKRRNVLNEAPEKRSNILIVAGCSYVFGDGLLREDTVSQLLADKAPSYYVYNYGKSGGGPHTFLDHFDPTHTKPTQGRAILVYMLWQEHIGRAIGTMQHINLWRKDEVYYEIENGRAVNKGTYALANPLRTRIYELIGNTNTVKYLHFNWPHRITEDHVLYTVRLLAAAKQRFLERYPNGEFLVLNHSMTDTLRKQIESDLKSAGLAFHDVDPVINGSYHPDYYLTDGHPSRGFNNAVAEFLVKTLKL